MNILSALSDIHRNNVIHCDIKPENFLLFIGESNSTSKNNIDDEENSMEIDDDEEIESVIKLTDFGLSHIISNGNTKAYLKFPCGSYGYSAPEKKSV